jgi:hypothetical protein
MENEAVPKQAVGAHFDVRHTVVMPERAAAIQRYAIAGERLLSVSLWGC